MIVPQSVPKCPNAVYTAQWAGWEDFLSVRRTQIVEDRNLARLRKICERLRSKYKGKWTYHQREIGLTKNDRIWINNKKKARLEGKRNWFPSLEAEAERLGFEGLFDTPNEAAVRRLQYIIGKYKTDDALPTTQSRGDEKSDYIWINTKREAKKLHLTDSKRTSNWYPQLDEIAKEYGFEGMFDPRKEDQEIIQIKRLKTIIAKYKTAANLPSIGTKRLLPEQEDDARWINTRARAKRCGGKKGKGTWTWYPVLEEIARKHGFEGMFDPKPKGEDVVLRRLNEILDRYTPKTIPSINSDDEQEYRDARWLVAKRAAKRRASTKSVNGGHIWYPSIEQRAKERGFDNLFSTEREFLKFVDARRFVRALKLKNRAEYFAWCKSSKKPVDIPYDPLAKYMNDGWKGWRDWLGND